MTPTERLARAIPRFVTSVCANFGAWVVGSAAHPDNLSPRDWDVVVPFSRWNDVAHMIPLSATPNRFGGWKFKDNDGNEIDVWPGEVSWLMFQPRIQQLWNPHLNRRFTASDAFAASVKGTPEPAPAVTPEHLAWEVHIVGSTSNPIAAFRFQDQAGEWAEKHYRGRHALVHVAARDSLRSKP